MGCSEFCFDRELRARPLGWKLRVLQMYVYMMATLENVNAKLIPSNYIKAVQMEYVIWNTSFGKVGIKKSSVMQPFLLEHFQLLFKRPGPKYPEEQKFWDTSLLMCGPLQCTQTAKARIRTVLRYRLFLYHVIFKHKHTHRHIERKPKRSKAVGGSSVWSNPRRRFSKEECRTSNT